MNFKVGDQILLRATITDVNKDAIYPYAINIELGQHNWTTDDFSCDSSAIVAVKNKDISEKCSCLHEEYGKQVCYGTKEREECSCEGDITKCNFYLEKRIDKLTDITEKGTIVTADLYQTTLEKISYMDYCDILTEFDIPEYGDVRDKAEAVVYLIQTHTPKDVVDIYEKYQDKIIVHVNDIIKGVIYDPRQYLVTKIDRCLFHLISKDGYTKTVNDKCVINNEYQKVKSNVSIQDFFNKEA